MVLCKICGTVYDEFYGLCPKCGTPCESEDEASDALPPIGKLSTPKASAPGALPSIEDALRNSGDADDSDATLPVGLPPIDPDATIPVSKPSFDPDATIPVTRAVSADPDATVPLGQQPRTFSADPDATVPLGQQPRTFSADPDATVPLGQRSPYAAPDPDATVPMTRQPVAPVVNPKGQTQDVYVPEAARHTQYGDNYDSAPVPSAVAAKKKKKGSAGKVIVIILLVLAILAGCGVGVYFLFLKPNQTPQISVEQLVSDGDKYISEGKTSEAIDSYKKAIEAKPDDPQLYLKLADVYIGTGDNANAVKTLEEGYEKTKNDAIKTKLDALGGKTEPTSSIDDDPDTLRGYARSMNMALMNIYAAVTSGDLNSSTPSDQLKGLVPSKLPAAGATAADKESAANALTMNDVLTYAGETGEINSSNIGMFVYDGAQIYYGADHAGKTLSLDTTVGDIRGFTPEESSAVSEPSEESSEPQASVITDPKVIEAELDDACKQLYSMVISGTLNQSTPAEQLHGLSASKLPKNTASTKVRQRYADNLTVADAITYAELGASVDGLNIIDYNYYNAEITYRGKGTPLALDTTLGEIMTVIPESSDESKPEESKPEESSAIEKPVDTRFVGQWKTVFNTKKYSQSDIDYYKSVLGWDEFDIILSGEGNASAYSVLNNTTNIVGTGTWTSSGDAVTVTIDGDAVLFVYDNGVLTTENFGDIAWFEKNDGTGPEPQPSEVSEPSEVSQDSTPSFELPVVPDDAYGVICIRIPEDWDENNLSIRVYDYDGNKNENNAKLTSAGGGIYTYTVNKYSSTDYLFNNPKFVILSTNKDTGNIVQTEEIYVPRSSKLYTAEKQGRKYVLKEN